MLYALIFAGLVALVAVAAFVWTVVRTAVEQAVDNRRREHRTEAPVAWWDTVSPDAPVPFALVDEDEVDPSHTPAGYAPDGLGVRPQPMSELRRKAY